MYMATSQQTLQRSLDSGATWQPVFNDAAGVDGNPSSLAPFAARDMQVPTKDGLVIAESGNGDAIVTTADQGRTWTLADGGIEGKHLGTVNVAPGNPKVMYASSSPLEAFSGPVNATAPTSDATPSDLQGGQNFVIYVTEDGGQHWTPHVLPDTPQSSEMESYHLRRPQLQIDPTNPGHVWAMV